MSAHNTTFPYYHIFGTAQQRGLQQGSYLAAQICEAITLYRALFNLPEADILSQASHYRQIVADWRPDYCEEIEAIARGAKVNPLWIYALNARSEILNSRRYGLAMECTSVLFSETALLAQNWDWVDKLEPLMALIHYELPNGHRILTFSEPGLLGKISLNSAGIGVCLNLLAIDSPCRGVPVHLILRAIAECTSLQEVEHLLKTTPVGCAGNVLIGDSEGNGIQVEFAGDRCFTMRPLKGVLSHTNHFLSAPINPENELFHGSYVRMRRVEQIIPTLAGRGLGDIKALLGDNTDPDFQICADYKPHHDLGTVGTVATLVMDLSACELLVARNPSENNHFERYSVRQAGINTEVSHQPEQLNAIS